MQLSFESFEDKSALGDFEEYPASGAFADGISAVEIVNHSEKQEQNRRKKQGFAGEIAGSLSDETHYLRCFQ
jgi:hypothetical protein